MSSNRQCAFSILIFMISYGLLFFALSPMLLDGVLPLVLVMLFSAMIAGPSFMITLFFLGYLSRSAEGSVSLGDRI